MGKIWAGALALLIGCGTEADEFVDFQEPGQIELSSLQSELSADIELERVTAIRDVAAGQGLTNAALLAGIAESETNLRHCWSEATWACKGPSSPSCGGGPVLAGSGDGACSLKKGGLGMFQFDGGTHAQTLDRDGEEILLLEGNISHAVDVVGEMIDWSVSGVDSAEEGVAWMNGITIQAGDPGLEKWASTMACRYNGCCGSSNLCSQRRRKYRDNAIALHDKYGSSFWDTAGTPPQSDCAPVPSDGRIIDEMDDCFEAQGPSQYWRSVETGFDGGSLWTHATAGSSGANVGTWKLFVETPGRYRVDAHMDGSVHAQSAEATYEIEHALGTSDVAFDQSAAGNGFATLGEFDFTPKRRQRIRLADNTGEPSSEEIEILFDAVQLTRVGDYDDTDVPAVVVEELDDAGGCAASGSGRTEGLAGVLAAVLGLGVTRRRRRDDSRLAG